MLPQFTQNFAIPPKSSNDLGKEKFFHLVIRAQLNIQGGENKITVSNPIYNAIYVERINTHQNCVLTAIEVICKDCEIRILHERVQDVVCSNCNYSFGNSCDHRQKQREFQMICISYM